MYFLSYRNVRFSHLVFHTFFKKYCVRRCLNSRGVDREKNFIVMYSMIVIFWSVISGNILPIWTVFSYYEHYFKTHSRNFRRLALSYLCLGRRLIRSFKLALPSGQSPGHLIFWRLFCSNSLHLGQKLYSNAPPDFFFRKMQNQRRGLLHIDQASKRRPCRPFFLSHSPAKVDYLPGAPPYLKI